MDLYVVDDHFDTLFGRKWITQFTKEINFVELFSNGIHILITTVPCPSIKQKEQMNYLLFIYQDVFSDVAVHLKDHQPQHI